jgi:hypothetical protein
MSGTSLPAAGPPAPPIQAQSADGVVHEFPAGTDTLVINKVMKDYAQRQAQVDPKAAPLTPSELRGPLSFDSEVPSQLPSRAAIQSKDIQQSAGAGISGVVKGVGGILSAVTDQIDPALGKKIADRAQQMSVALRGPDSKMTGVSSLLEAGGEAAPLVAGGAAGLGLKGAIGGGALAGLVSPQDGANVGERNEGRVVGALVGAATGGALKFGGGLVTKAVTKIANAKKLDAVLKELTDTITDHIPESKVVGQQVGTTGVAAQAGYVRQVDRIRQATKVAPPIDGQPIVDAVDKATELGTKGSALNRLLAQIKESVKPYAKGEATPAVPGKDANLLNTILKGSNPRAQQRYVEQGFDLFGTPERPGAPGTPTDLLHLDSLSTKIAGHLKTLSSDELASPEASGLRDVKKTIDDTIQQHLEGSPSLARHYATLKQTYKPVLDLASDPVAQSLSDRDPAVRRDALLTLVKSGDSEQLKRMIPLLGGPGSAAREDAYNTVLHDAYTSALDKKSGKVDAKKFSSYFAEPGVKNAIGAIETPTGKRLREGIANLIDFGNQSGTREAKHHALSRFTDYMGAEMVGRALEKTFGMIAGGHFNAVPMASAIAGAYGMRKAAAMADGLLGNRLGVNFLLASSRVKPESPEMARLVWRFNRQMQAIAPPVAGQQSSQSQARPGPPQAQ